MFDFNSVSEAPEASQEALRAAKKKFGFLPNLLKGLSVSPAAVRSYLGVMENLSQSTLTPAERELLFIAISERRDCEYCIAAHSGGGAAHGLPAEAIAALQQGRSLDDPRLDALARFARLVVDTEGHVARSELEEFFAAGFTRANVFDVVTAVAVKTISNYGNHILDTPLDAPLARFARPRRKVA